MKPILLSLVLFVCNSSFSQDKMPDCKVLKRCKVKYANDSLSRYEVEFKGNRHILIDHYDETFVKSKVKWTSECEFQLTVIEEDLIDSGVDPGQVYSYKIERITGNRVDAVLIVEGQSFPVHYILLE